MMDGRSLGGRVLLAAASAAAVCGVLAGCESATPAAVETPPPVVSVSRPLARTVVDYDIYTGRTDAVKTVDIRARVQGYLQEVNFVEGEEVKAGQVLFRIDPREYQAALDGAEAEVARAEAKRELARAEVSRYQQLARKDAASRQELDIRLAAMAEAEAEIAAGKADVTRAELDLGFTEVQSPIDGRVGRDFINVGNLVSPASPESNLLTNVVSIDPIYVYFDIDERSLLRYQRRRGAEAEAEAEAAGTGPPERLSVREADIHVEMALADETGFPHKGVIDFGDNRVDPATGTIKVRGVFPNEGGQLRPGLFARVRIPVTDPHEALLATERAVGSDQGIPFVYVVDAEDKAQAPGRHARAGLRGDAGDRVGGRGGRPGGRQRPPAGRARGSGSIPTRSRCRCRPAPRRPWPRWPRGRAAAPSARRGRTAAGPGLIEAFTACSRSSSSAGRSPPR